MIHYHGTPISSRANAAKFLMGRHALVSHACPTYIEVAAEVCQSFVLDNGAFSHFTKGAPKTEWADYYAWAGEWLDMPTCDWALIPDVIGGTAEDNDRLWVRETWMKLPDGKPFWKASWGNVPEGSRWTPSIHMPRWASRITLEITGVRVERLQAISEADCIAEGCSGVHDAIPGYNFSATPLEHYRKLWESINGPGSWDTNPFVWCVSFRRVMS